MKYKIGIISHNRPGNVQKIQEVINTHEVTFYVNDGEAEAYKAAGALRVVECGTNICQARNMAIKEATEIERISIQVSDDLKGIKRVHLEPHTYKRLQSDITFKEVVDALIKEMLSHGAYYGGVAINNNPLNYTGLDVSYNKLVVCDLIAVMPTGVLFDEEMYLKEDYAITITELLAGRNVVRLNNMLCNFPHRENEGGANGYRTTEAEAAANARVMAKWPEYVKPHATRENQISLNYLNIQLARAGAQQKNLFDL